MARTGDIKIEQLFAGLTAVATVVDISLEGHPTACLRAFPAWDTGIRTLPVHLLYDLESRNGGQTAGS